jgi:hypothetical protein
MATPTNLPGVETAGTSLPAAWLNDLRGAFRILQVLQTTTNTQATFTTSTPASIGLSLSITPQAVSNKILLIASIGGCNKQLNNTGLDLYIYKNGAQLLKSSANVCRNGTGNEENGHASALFLDSPNTTSAVTFAIFGASAANNAFAIAQHQAAWSSLVLCEVSA